MIGNHTIGLVPAHLVDDVFTVCKVTKLDRARGHVYWATMANHARQYDAIAGPSAAALATGKLIRVRGCLLLRKGKPVLVVCSLKPAMYLALL